MTRCRGQTWSAPLDVPAPFVPDIVPFRTTGGKEITNSFRWLAIRVAEGVAGEACIVAYSLLTARFLSNDRDSGAVVRYRFSTLTVVDYDACDRYIARVDDDSAGRTKGRHIDARNYNAVRETRAYNHIYGYAENMYHPMGPTGPRSPANSRNRNPDRDARKRNKMGHSHWFVVSEGSAMSSALAMVMTHVELVVARYDISDRAIIRVVVSGGLRAYETLSRLMHARTEARDGASIGLTTGPLTGVNLEGIITLPEMPNGVIPFPLLPLAANTIWSYYEEAAMNSDELASLHAYVDASLIDTIPEWEASGPITLRKCVDDLTIYAVAFMHKAGFKWGAVQKPAAPAAAKSNGKRTKKSASA